MKCKQQTIDMIFRLMESSNNVLVSVGDILDDVDQVLKSDYDELSRLYHELQNSMSDLELYLRVVEIDS